MKTDKLTKPIKIVIGILTIWPFVYIPVFIYYFFSSFFLQSIQDAELPTIFLPLFIVHMLTILISMALLVVFILDLIHSDRVDKDKKTLWALFLLFGGGIAMPFYWYLYIWKSPKANRKTL